MKFDIDRLIADRSVVTLKLIGGDELICRIFNKSNEADGNMTVTKPLLVAMSQQGFGLMPFALTMDTDTVQLAQNSIVCYGKTVDRVAAEYLKQTTGLIV